MTSRRSRLKAVTNLPVRRKTLTSQGSGNEDVIVDNLTSEKINSSGLKDNEINVLVNKTQPSHDAEKDVNDVLNENENIGGEPAVIVNCVVSFQNNENPVKDIYNNKTDAPSDSEILENATDSVKSSSLSDSKTESETGSLFRSIKRSKPSLVSSPLKDKAQVPTPENKIGIENSNDINCIAISNNIYNSNNNNNNDVEEGFKCYTVVTSQNVTLTPLEEYTLTPLTSCENTFIEATLDPPQAYEEVPIYTDIGPAELYINNEVIANYESVIETESLEPVLTNLTNCSSEQEVKNLNYENLNNFLEYKSPSGNVEGKPAKKNKTFILKNSYNKNNKHFRNSVAQAKDSHILENTVLSGNQSASADVHSYKQNVSTVRRRRSKYNDFTKKLADAKREFQKKYEKTKPDRSTLKMIDLIFYNPATNPMESKSKFEKKDTLGQPSDEIQDLLAEEKIDEPEAIDNNSRSKFSDNSEIENLNKMPVPQVKIGRNGEIILDEKSLVIETTDAKKGREGLQNSVPIFEDRECKVSYYRGKSKKTRDWADVETKRFYKALNTIGPDFTLMQKYFPKRSRLELKNKFKREERLNRNLIDKALNNPSEFDMTQLEKDLAVEEEAEEEEIEMRLCRIMKQTARKPRMKSSFLSREIIDPEVEPEESQVDLLNQKSKTSENEKSKKEKEFDFVFQKLLMKETSHNVLPEISSSSNVLQYSDNGVT